MIDAYSDFVVRFESVRKEAQDTPGNVRFKGNNQRKMRELCFLLKQAADFAETQLLAHKDRPIQNVPRNFERLREVYKNGWEGVVAEQASRFQGEQNDLIQRVIRHSLEKLQKDGLSDAEAVRKMLTLMNLDSSHVDSDRPPRPNFDVLSDDPIRLIENAFDLAEGWALDTIWTVSESDYDEILKGVEAWSYVRDTIGVDLDAIYSRWKSLPQLVITKGSSIGERLRKKRPDRLGLDDLWQEAMRSFVFGNTHACLALCRAIHENVRKQYFAESESKDLLNTEYYELANRILHGFEKESAVTEDTTLKYLEWLRTLIQKIPASR